MYVFWSAVILMEAGLPLCVNGSPDLYPLYSETRHLLWIYGAYALSEKRGMLLRSALLLAVISQCLSVVVFAIDLLGVAFPVSPHIEALVMALSVCWVILRSYCVPESSIPLRDMRTDAVYVLAKFGHPKRLYDIVLSLCGYPATSVSIFCMGDVYQYRKAVTGADGVAVYTRSKYKPSRGDIYRCAIPTDLDPREVKKLLDKKVGTKYRLYRANCASTPDAVWRLLGIKRKAVDALPGVITARILWRLSRRNTRRDRKL